MNDKKEETPAEDKYFNFKYADKLKGLACDMVLCVPQNMKAYRYCRLPVETKANQIPMPMIEGTTVDGSECDHWGLSFFTTHEKALANMRKRCKKTKAFMNMVGDQIVEAQLQEDHGLCGPAGKSGHFDFFEYGVYGFVDSITSVTPITL